MKRDLGFLILWSFNYTLGKNGGDMKLQQVESSMIQAVGYDENTEILEVVFNSGKTYYYSEVPQEVYEGLLSADSKGSYMQYAVVDCYPYRQVRKRHR